MSAFFCCSRTIDDAVVAMLPDGLPNERTALGRKLWRLNADAVYQRYDHIPEEVEQYHVNVSDAETYVYETIRQPSKAQQFKSLCCLSYQCSEGDVPQRPLYAKMIAVEKRFADEGWTLDDIACRRAAWDYPYHWLKEHEPADARKLEAGLHSIRR